jgi:hypothetical protein
MQRLMDSPHALRPGRRLKTSVYLREPIARAISGMHHVCVHRTKRSFELDEVLRRVRSGERHMGYAVENWTTKFLSCSHGRTFPHDDFGGDCSPDLAIAKRLVDSAFHLGITERYAASLCILGFLTNQSQSSLSACTDVCAQAPPPHLSPEYSKHVHDGKDSPCNATTLHEPTVTALLREKNDLDSQLYEYALESWTRRARRVEQLTGWRLVCQVGGAPKP